MFVLLNIYITSTYHVHITVHNVIYICITSENIKPEHITRHFSSTLTLKILNCHHATWCIHTTWHVTYTDRAISVLRMTPCILSPSYKQLLLPLLLPNQNKAHCQALATGTPTVCSNWSCNSLYLVLEQGRVTYDSVLLCATQSFCQPPSWTWVGKPIPGALTGMLQLISVG